MSIRKAAPGCLPADASAHRSLGAAIHQLAEEGVYPHCAGSVLPCDDERELRALVAAQMCPGCPVFDECLAAGATEVFGVWGGQDRTDTTRTTTRKTSKEKNHV